MIKKNKLRNIAFIAFILLFTNTIFAETLNLQQCIDIALKENNKIKAFQHSVAKEEDKKKAVIYQFLPSTQLKYELLKIEYAPTPPDAMTFDVPAGPGTTMPVDFPLEYPSKIHDLSIELGQPVTALWSVYKAYSIGKTSEQIAKLQLKMTKRDVYLAVVKAYYNYLLLGEVHNLLQTSLEQLEQYQKRAQSFVDAHMADKRGVLKLKISILELQRQIKVTEQRMQTIKVALAIFMNRDEHSFDLQKESPDDIAIHLPKKEILALQNEHRLELKLFKKVEKINEDAKDIAYQPFIPSLVLIAGYKRNFEPLDMNPVKGNFVFGFNLSFPLFFNWGTSYHKLQAARSDILITKFNNINARQQMRLQIENILTTIELNKDKMDIAKRQIEEAKENLRIEENKYRVRMTTETDLLTANVKLRTAKATLLQSYYSYKASLYELAKTIGVDLKDIAE